ncbi:glycosyltransferase [Caproicibacter sp.]|uniref:glycosyltransferase n=1 Tax=Caproicibacter sp. TaxID=2814884 RepID=UPI003989DB93
MNELIDDRYVFRITDDTGMLQHAVSGVPDPTEGYTLDDNARALIMADLLYELSPEKKYEDLLYRYTSFLLFAQKRGWFRNFMGYDRRFLEKRGSEDSFGRCICSLGFTAGRKDLPSSILQASQKLLSKTYRSCSTLSYLKGKAYALTGLLLWGDPAGLPGAETLCDSIVDTYAQSRREDWRWFEDQMTYCSGILPLSLLCANEKAHQKKTESVALESLDFLLSITIRDGIFHPIGCKGWYQRGGSPAEFDEQPVEACCTMLACLAAYRLTGEPGYRESAVRCYRWYLGDNSLKKPLIDRETGGCRDGLTKNGINGNEGAESIVCWIISALMAKKEKLTDDNFTSAPS